MLIIRKAFRFFLFACGAILFSGVTSMAAAQADGHDSNPCETGSYWDAGADHSTTPGLTPVEDGTIVYDSNQGVCWLADGNLAGHPEVRSAVALSKVNSDGSMPVINPNGSMDYETSLNW